MESNERDHRLLRYVNGGTPVPLEVFAVDEWAAGAHYAVSMAAHELHLAGRITDPDEVRCGECGLVMARDDEGIARCPFHQ